MITNVAVYGSLLKGLHNHRLLSSSKSVGVDTVEGFDMFSRGQFPGIVPGRGKIKVEIYEVDQETLDSLDRLEGHPNFYKRTKITTASGVKASIYVLQFHSKNSEQVKSGDWKEHLESNRKSLEKLYGKHIFYDPKR